jgi:hypothetical protein
MNLPKKCFGLLVEIVKGSFTVEKGGVKDGQNRVTSAEDVP